ncbi:VOC family protein [Opitutaceae bacterium]|jgi:catechol 2,3-dioxygenase-like lactoylglutathione lyase family enzyme|nr:VOC family protein [Opitutaceae bacterium]
MKKLESYSSILAVSNLETSLAFYVDKLGFTKKSFFGTPPYVAEVQRDGTQPISLLCMSTATVSNNSIATLAFRCQEIDSLYEEFQFSGVVIDEEIDDKEYLMREFRIKDPDGYILYFQEPIIEEVKNAS